VGWARAMQQLLQLLVLGEAAAAPELALPRCTQRAAALQRGTCQCPLSLPTCRQDAQRGHQVHGGGGVQAAGGLVQQQHRRVDQQLVADAHALALAACARHSSPISGAVRPTPTAAARTRAARVQEAHARACSGASGEASSPPAPPSPPPHPRHSPRWQVAPT
jgi:hypothetical protein